jgi:hypothetical protein
MSDSFWVTEVKRAEGSAAFQVKRTGVVCPSSAGDEREYSERG